MQEFNSATSSNRDANELQNTGQNYSFALNATVENISEPQPEPYRSNSASNVFCYEVQENETVVKSLYINEWEKTILFVYNTDTFESKLIEITPLNEDPYHTDITTECSSSQEQYILTKPLCKYKVLFSSFCFDWSISPSIKYKITDCTISLYFVNNVDEDRFLILNEDLSLHEDFASNNLLLCNKTKWNPLVTEPCISLSLIPGNKKKGVYNYLIAYSTFSGIPLTNFKALTVPFHIYEETGGIKLDISNITKDSRYKYYTIVCGETVAGVTTYHKKQTLSVEKSVFIDTDNGGSNISLQNLVTNYPFYEKSEDITESNNILFKLGVSEYEKFNLQPVINKLELEWVTTVAKEGDYKDSEFSLNNKTFLRDEVYALGLELILDNGEAGPTFPFISRKSNIQDEIILQSNTDDCGVVTNIPRWKLQNTAKVNYTSTKSLEELYNNCSCGEIYQSGDFSYWESDVTYPVNTDVWEEYSGQKIRHFKFPDVAVSPHFANSSNFAEKNYIFPLGIKIKSDIGLSLDNAVALGLISQRQRERITGWKIVRSNRRGNKSIVAKGLLYDVWSYKRKADKDDNFYDSCGEDIDSTYHYPNYPYNDLNPDIFLSKTDTHYDFIQSGLSVPNTYNNNKQKFTFHSPETSFRKPNLGNKIKYEAEFFGEAKGFFNVSQDFAEYKLMSKKHYTIAKVFAHFISSTASVPSDEALTGIAQNTGKTIGSVVGGAIGTVVAPGVGTALGAGLGGAIGGFIGNLAGSNASKNPFSSMAFRHSIYLSTMDKVLDLLKAMSKSNQHHYQHQSIGNYNNLINVVNKNDEYLLEKEYLEEGKYTVKDGDGVIYFNNTDRESSVYFKSKNLRPDYKVIDNSRTLISENTSSFSEYETTVNIEDLVSYRLSASKGKYKVIYTKCDGTVIEEELSARGGQSFDKNFDCLLSLEVLQDKIFGADDPDVSEDLKVDIVTKECADCVSSTKKIVDYNCRCNAPTTRAISSFYVSNKIENPNQYGNISDIDWINLSSCNTNCNNVYMGGDSYIGRMSLKRKHNFFSRNTHKLPENTDFNYSIVPNVAYPKYFFDTVFYPKATIVNIGDITYPVFTQQTLSVRNMVNLWKYGMFNVNNLKPGNYNLDCYNKVQDEDNTQLIQLKALTGIIYTSVYGIPSFITESSYNLDLRDDSNNPQDKFYPKQSDLKTWLQESNVPIKIDNSYLFDESFLKESTESFKYIYDVNFKGKEECKTEHPNRVIYSSKSENIEDDNYSDSYLVNKALDYYDFTKEKGRAISIEGIEGDRVLVRMENTTYVYSSVIELNTDTNTVLISTGSIFKSKPVEYSSPTNGYFGTQHKAILHTAHGHLTIDAKRGHIFILGNGGQGLQEISNQGYRHWFKENLPFTILKQFPSIEVDNSYYGIGLSMVYDRKLETIYISKLDYEPKNKDIKYLNNKFYLNDVEIQLTDKRYFRDKSWTASYSFYRKEWVSFFTWKPNYYIELIDYFFSGVKQGLFQHNITNKSYQVFYNKVTPFIVETQMKGNLNPEVLKSVSYYADFIRYHNNYDYYYNQEKTFNKAIIYGKNSNSGLLLLNPRDNNYLKRLLYPIVSYANTKVEVVLKEGQHSFNQFKNRIKKDYTYLPQWLFDANNVDKQLNINAFNFENIVSNDYIRDTNLKVRLINDEDTRHKIIFKGLILDKDGRR